LILPFGKASFSLLVFKILSYEKYIQSNKKKSELRSNKDVLQNISMFGVILLSGKWKINATLALMNW
jgi:hypothetical protein